MKTITIEVRGHRVRLQELTIEEVEAIAVDFSQEQLSAGHARRFNNSVIAAAIVEVNGLTPSNLRELFPAARDWRIIDAAYQTLLGTPDIPAVNEKGHVVVKASDGRDVTLRQLDVDEDEALDVRNRYKARDWFRAGNDRAAAGIIAIDGKSVGHATFNPRVEFPAHSDWNHFRAAYQALNEVPSVEAFLLSTQPSPSTTER